MCRATLEAALLERFEGLYDPDAQSPNLHQLRQIAGENKILLGYEPASPRRRPWRARAGTLLWRAQRIERSGNCAGHTSPTLRQEEHDVRDACEAIPELSNVLDALFPRGVGRTNEPAAPECWDPTCRRLDRHSGPIAPMGDRARHECFGLGCRH